MLTVLGVIIGGLDRKFFEINDEPYTAKELAELPYMEQVKEDWHNPEPAMIFLIFLPALIFESAINSDWFTFKR